MVGIIFFSLMITQDGILFLLKYQVNMKQINENYSQNYRNILSGKLYKIYYPVLQVMYCEILD